MNSIVRLALARVRLNTDNVTSRAIDQFGVDIELKLLRLYMHSGGRKREEVPVCTKTAGTFGD